MPVLYEPDAPEDSFELTPDCNQLLVEWEIENPDHPDPRFDAQECVAFTFRWPGTAPKPTALEARRAGRCHLSFADRPAYDAHRVLVRPCLDPALLGQEPIADRGWGWPAREAA